MPHPTRKLGDRWRMARVAFHLLRRPQDIAPYWRHSVRARVSPLDLQLPWWTFGAINALDRRLSKNHDVFEYGSGGSTLFLARRAATLLSIEDEKPWFQLVRDALTRHQLDATAQIKHVPYDFWHTADFTTSAYLHALDGRRYDVIIVDGKEWSDPVRDQCFWHAENHLKPGGLIILDDSWRYPQVFARHRAKSVTTYRGTGPCRLGVTSTTFFEY